MPEMLQGWVAYKAGALRGIQYPDPYPLGSREASEWRVGWLAASMAEAVELHKHGAWPWKE
jgi:hypothetical protein